MPALRHFPAFAIVLAVALPGCGRKAPETPLGYVPADTPYVFANVEPLPVAHVQAWSQRFGPLAGMYAGMLDKALAELEKPEHAAEPGSKVARALLAEMKGKISVAGFEQIGFTTQARWAFYGVGLAPVMRIELRDPKALAAFVGRVEQRLGEPLPRARVGKQDYWRLGKADAQLAGVMAIADDDLVLALAPRQASEDLLERLLGLELPDESLEESGGIASLNREFGFTSYGSGYLDTVRFATAMADAHGGLEREYLAALGWEAGSKPTPACRTELLEMAANAPRFVFGYTRFEPAAIDTLMVLQTSPAIAAELQGLAAPVPGLGAPSTALIDFGMSLKLEAVNTAVSAHASAIAAKPYQCEQLAPLNAGSAQLQTQVANPVTFAAAPVFMGFRGSLTRLELDTDEPVFAGKLLVASNNPRSLVAMAQSFAPQLKELKLQPGGPPVPLPDAPGTEELPPTHVLMADKAIAFAVGEGEEQGLAEYAAQAPAPQPPLLAFGYSGRFLSEMLAFSGRAAASAAAPSSDSEEMKKLNETLRAVYGETVERLDTTLVATDRGLELHQGMRFK